MSRRELRHATLLGAGGVIDAAKLLGIVASHGGQVEQSEPILVSFGLRKPAPDAAKSAVRAGLLLAECELRVGIHSGRVEEGERLGGEAVDETLQLAQAAPAGRVWISRSVQEVVRRFFNLHAAAVGALPAFEVAFELDSAPLAGPRFLGRQRELDELAFALQHAQAERKLEVVVVRGPSGVGKTRLLSEFTAQLERQRTPIRLDVCHFDDSSRLPSHGLASLLRGRFNLPLHLDDDDVLGRLRDRMKRENPFVERGRQELAVQFFAFVLGIARPDFQIAALDGPGKWEGVFVEIKRWMEGWAARAPWIWLLHDAHRADPETFAFLGWALRLKWNAPLLVLASARDEELAPEAPPERWVAAGRAREIRLRELPVEVLAEALSDGGLPLAAARRIAAHTEGNPLFATELALLVRDGRPLDAALPGTVRDVMEARIERLGGVGKEVAKRAALVGRRFTRDAVLRIWDDTPEELDAGLRALVAAEAIAEEPSPIGDSELVFRHQRLADAALARVPPAERQGWLDRLGAWAESELQRHPTLPFLVDLAARACEARGDLAAASAWRERLGHLHEGNHRSREAAVAFEAALAGAGGVRRRVILRHLCENLRRAGEPARALEMLDHKQQKADLETTDELAAADRTLELVRAETLSELARTAEARAAFEALRPRLHTDLERLRFARGMVFLLSELLGEPKAAQRICEELRAQVAMDDPQLGAERLALLAAEGNVEWRLGRYDRAAQNTDDRLALAQTRGDRQAECIAWNLKGTVQGARGDFTGAMIGYERSLAVAQAIGHRLREAIALHNLGLVHADQGEWDRARTRQEQYLTLSAMIGNHLSEAHGPRALASIAVATRQYADGEAQVDRALAAADKNGWPLLTAWARAVRGQLALRRYLDQREAGELERATVELAASETQWAFSDDAGEYFAFLACAQTLAGQPESARQTLERAKAAIDASWTLGRAWIQVAGFLIERKSPGAALDWFRERGHTRAVTLLAPLARVLQ